MAGLALGTMIWACGGCRSSSTSGVPGFLEPLFPPSPSDTARDAFNAQDADKRRNAVNLLSNAPFGGQEPYVRTYRLLIDDPDPTVRAACVAALGRHGSPDDVALILRYLGGDSPVVRWEAARALQRLHNPQAIDPLIKALAGDDSVDVRIAAANALGQYRVRKVFDALIGALNDRDYGVVVEAGQALQTLTGENFRDDGAQWLAWARQTPDVFAGAQPYYYRQYVKPRSLLNKAMFWEKPKTPAPKPPRGLEATDMTPRPVY
jgi:hypothetical protein